MFSSKTVVIGSTALLLAGCGGGSSEGDDRSTHTSRTLNLPNAVAEVSYAFRAEVGSLSGDITYRAKQLPEWASIAPATGEITGNPEADDVSAKVPVSIEATNGKHTVT